MTGATARDPGPDDLQGVLVQAPTRIESLLRQLRQQRVLLSIRASGESSWHTSLVVAIDAKRNRLSLDPPQPPLPAPLGPGTLLNISGRIDGSDLRFHCRHAGTAELDGSPALLAEFPEHVLILERRETFRLKLPEFLRLEPSQIQDDQGQHEARLVDLSHEGAGAIIPDHVEPAVGDTLTVSLHLQDATIETEAVVRSITPGRNGVRVGLQLEALRQEDEKQLAQAISRLERQLIRATRAAR